MDKPELVVFSQNKIGGVQSYYYNLLKNDLDDEFRKTWVFTDHSQDVDARLLVPYNCCDEKFFTWTGSWTDAIARRLARLVSNSPGVVLCNHEPELMALRRFPRKSKTVFFVCHDELYLGNAVKYEFMIDAYIAHNRFFFESLRDRLPARINDIYYLPYGIQIFPFIRMPNPDQPLRLLFLARVTRQKGIYDLSVIDDLLISKGVHVSWTVVGDGPERTNLMNLLASRSNFSFHTVETTREVLEIASHHDIYILPSYLDGLPVALLEAMSVGLVPVISKFNGGIDAVVRPDNGYIVPIGDNCAFADTISRLHDDRPALEKLSANARRTVEKEYEVSARSRDYYSLFRDFRRLKKKLNYSRLPGTGRLNHPLIPQFVRDSARKLKGIFASVK